MDQTSFRIARASAPAHSFLENGFLSCNLPPVRPHPLVRPFASSKIRPAVPFCSSRFQSVDPRTGKRTRHEGLLRISIIVDNSAGCIPSILAVVSGNSPHPRDYLAPGIPISPPTLRSLPIPVSVSLFLSLYLCLPRPPRTPNMPSFSFSLIFILVFGSAFDLYRITSLDILCTSVLLPSRCKTPVLFYFILLGESRRTYMYYVYVSVRILELDMTVISRLGRD